MELSIDIFVFFNGNFGHMALSVQNNRLNYPPSAVFYAQFMVFCQFDDP